MPPRSSKKQAGAATADCAQSQASTRVPSLSGQEPATSVVLWLRDQVEEAWRKEAELKKMIRTVAESKQQAMETEIERLSKQTGHVREEVERWQMRNEEVEQHLQRWMQRCWSLKQVIWEQQKLIRAQTAEREEFRRQLKRSKNETENAYSFAKFECTKYKKVIQQDKVIQDCQQMLEQGRSDAKEAS